MISNFHSSAGPYEEELASSSYYTFDPSPSLSKKVRKKPRRIFGSKKNKAKKQEEDLSTVGGGQSLTYSSASSYQTSGECTDSSFGDILRMLDEEDARQRSTTAKQSSDRSICSSLAYSEGGTTLNYSTDGDQSYLEGTKLLLNMHKEGLLGNASDYSTASEEKSFDISDQLQFAPAVQPKSVLLKTDTGPRTVTNTSRKARGGETKEEYPEEQPEDAAAPWLCGMDMSSPIHQKTRNVLKPFLCFL